MKTKEPSQEFKAQVSDYVPKKRKRPWSLPPPNTYDPSQVQNLEEPNHSNSFGSQNGLSENQNAKNSEYHPLLIPGDSKAKVSDNQITTNQNTQFQSSDIQNTDFQITTNQHTENQLSKKQISEKQLTDNQTTRFQITEKPHTQRPIKKPRLQKSESETARVGELGISYGGFMPLNCLIFDQSIFSELKPGEFKLYTYLLFLAFRYPEGKNHVRAAITYLVAGTGMKKDAIIAHLKRLNELNLAKCVEQNQKVGNLYLINTTYLWNTTKVLSENQNTENKNTDKTRTTSGFPDGSTLENRALHSENQTQDKTYIENKSLSKNEEHIFIQTYLSKLPQAKLKKEREAFLSLKTNYSEGDIETCLSYLQAYGELKTGEPCHSPLSYLSLAMNDVLKKIQEKQKKSRGADDSFERQKKEEIFRAEQQRKEEEAFKLKEKAFLEKFTTESEQLSQVEKLVDGFPVNVGPEIARRIAINSWWEKSQDGEPK